MQRFLAGFFAVRNTEMSREKNCADGVFKTKPAKALMTVPNCIIDMMETRTILRTSEVQTMQKLKDRPKFTGSF